MKHRTHYHRCRFCGKAHHMREVQAPARPGAAAKAFCPNCGRTQTVIDMRERERLVRVSAARFEEVTGKKYKKPKRLKHVGQAAIERYAAVPSMPASLAEPLCFAYGRLSKDEDESVSKEAQKARIDEFYERRLAPEGIRFWTDGYFFDLGVSGGVPMHKRPAGAALLATLQRGDTVIVSKLDRAFRDAEDGMRVIRQLRERGIQAYFVDFPDLPDGAAGDLVFMILAAAAAYERRRISERTKEALAIKRKNGQAVGGAPTGWLKTGFKETSRYIPDPIVRQTAEQIVQMRGLGLGWRDIHHTLLLQGLDRSLATSSRHDLSRVKRLYCLYHLRWPKAGHQQIRIKELLPGDELGLKALASLPDDTLDTLLRDPAKLRNYLRAAWLAAAETEAGKDEAPLQIGEARSTH